MALCYGDVISLQSAAPSGVGGGMLHLHAEGHRDARLWVCEPSPTGEAPADLEGCLFELLPMLQYASRARRRFCSTRNRLLVHFMAPEAMAARRLRARRSGGGFKRRDVPSGRADPSCGHVVILRHVRSGKLVSLSESACPHDPSCTLVNSSRAAPHAAGRRSSRARWSRSCCRAAGGGGGLISPTSQQRLRISPSVLPEPRGGLRRWRDATGSRSALGIGGGMGGGMGGIGAAPAGGTRSTRQPAPVHPGALSAMPAWRRPGRARAVARASRRRRCAPRRVGAP